MFFVDGANSDVGPTIHGHAGEAAHRGGDPQARYDTLKASHGIEVAQKAIAEAVRKSAMEQAGQLAGAAGETSLQTFIARQEPWLRGESLTIEVKEHSDTRYRYNVTRCKYAEMYRDMGLGEIGHLLSCQRDGTFCEGYDDRIKLKRTQTTCRALAIAISIIHSRRMARA